MPTKKGKERFLKWLFYAVLLFFCFNQADAGAALGYNTRNMTPFKMENSPARPCGLK